MQDDVDVRPTGPSVKRTNPASRVLKVMFIIGFSLASWFAWDYVFERTNGVCVGPICIHQGDRT